MEQRKILILPQGIEPFFGQIYIVINAFWDTFANEVQCVNHRAFGFLEAKNKFFGGMDSREITTWPGNFAFIVTDRVLRYI